MSPINWPDIAGIPELVKSGYGKSGHEEPLRIFGQEIYIKVTGGQTGGAWSMIQQVSPPGGGPPMHRHTREDEAFFILEGKFLFQVGEDRIETNPGDFLFAPRNIPHTLLNIGDVPAKALVVMSPSGMENFFLAVAALEGPPDPVKVGQLFADYGIDLIGPPLTP
jgi:quercetin dioxygenase-like cupin family protein